MFIIKNFIYAIAKLLEMGLDLYFWIIILSAIFSWVNASDFNPIVRFVRTASNFVLYPLRRRFNLVIGMIDFSPIIVIMLITFAKNFLVRTLIDISMRM